MTSRGYSLISSDEISEQDGAALIPNIELPDSPTFLNQNGGPSPEHAAGSTHNSPRLSFPVSDDIEALPSTSYSRPNTSVTFSAAGSVHPLRDIPDVTLNRELSLTSTHYFSVEHEENLKLVVSSVLFIAIVIVIIVVAFVWNPSV